MGNRRIRFTHARSQLVGTVGTARTSPDSVTWLRGRGQPGSLHGIVSRRRDDFNLLNTHTHTHNFPFTHLESAIGLYTVKVRVAMNLECPKRTRRRRMDNCRGGPIVVQKGRGICPSDPNQIIIISAL
jgi:hypothetical protein